jgi:microcystin-dependent protein
VLIVGNQAYVLGGYGAAAQPLPTGIILPYDGTTAPAGFVLAVGGTLVRATYPALNSFYSAQSYPYGNGNGSTTFGIPDGRGKTLVAMLGGSPNFATHGASAGEENHTLTTAEIPGHTHGWSFNLPVTPSGNLTTGAAAAGTLKAATLQNNSSASGNTDSGTGGGGGHNNVQPSLVIGGFIIKT